MHVYRVITAVVSDSLTVNCDSAMQQAIDRLMFEFYGDKKSSRKKATK